jgi:hypothetical protein
MHTNEFDYTYSDTLVFNTWFDELNIRITILDDILVQIEDMTIYDLGDLSKPNTLVIFSVDIDLMNMIC